MKAIDALARHGLADGGVKLGGFISRQRWFAGKQREIASTTVEDAAPLRQGEVAVIVVIARVQYEDGGVERYHVPLAARHDASTVWEGNVVGTGVREGRDVVFYDALADGDGAWAFWEAMASGAEIDTDAGAVMARNEGLALDVDGPQSIRPLGREQSNSSMVRAEREVLKVFRRLTEGLSPEIEMTEALAERGFTHVPAPLSVMQYRREGHEDTLLAIVQPYLTGGTEGWALALTSLRDLLASAAAGDEPEGMAADAAVLAQGSNFIPESERIGQVTARMHLALAGDGLPPPLRPEPIAPATLRAWAEAMRGELDGLIERGGEAVQALLPVRPQLHRALLAITELADRGLAIRYHGDYHLGQLLRTNSGWTVLDFEGEPDRDIEARRARSSPLRDVAGMMRSLDYAAAVELRDWSEPAKPDHPLLASRAEAWARLNREAFWRAYLAEVTGTPLLPSEAAASVLLRAYQIQKAVYEVAYELGHRPDWVTIPLAFLLGAAAGGEP